MDENNLIPIPRVESRAPHKNTIEWEMPRKVMVSLMLVEKIGYTFIAQVKVKKSIGGILPIKCSPSPIQTLWK